MKLRYTYFYFLILLSAPLFYGCKKDTLTSQEKSITQVNVFEDTEIGVPIEVVAGKGTLLSAYCTNNTQKYRFILTDNNGKHLWTKEFGLTRVSAMLAEEDGTFTIFEDKRLLTIDVSGTILRDIPNFLSVSGITDFITTHVMLTKSGNYFFYGRINLLVPNYAFAYEITHSGAQVFKKIFTANTFFTGCQQTADGGYLFLGNEYKTTQGTTTRFFICKMSATGTVLWTKYYVAPGKVTGTVRNFYYTHDILESNDGNYFCFVSSANHAISDAARIYKVTPDGKLLDSIDINFVKKNYFVGGNEYNQSALYYPFMNGYCSVKKPDGSYLVYLNFRPEQVVNSSITGASQTFAIHFNDDLSVNHIGYLQQSYADFYTSVCRTSDGQIAAFGIISSLGLYNKPVLLITE